MRPRRLSEIGDLLGTRRAGPDVEVSGVSVDSRRVQPGDLFVALPGETMDGSGFIEDAFAKGAAAVLSPAEVSGRPSLTTPDPAAALLELARRHRASLPARVVGITGSVGKTSVKDLCAAVLATRYSVVSSPLSYNTEIGLPLTLLSADEGTDVIVCEMGSRGAGHIARLCDVARPDVGVVTSVGAAHLEMFGSLAAVAEAKAELVEALPAEGTAVLNADDDTVRGFGSRTRARVVTYGFATEARVRGTDLVLDAAGMPRFSLGWDGATEVVELPIPGEHMASNALGASAVGMVLGLEPGECAAGLKAARLSPWRMETFETAAGVRVVNDAYNANPMSTAAALKAARWIAGDGRCLAVLGEMAELGEASAEHHERIGELAARLGIARLVVVGPDAGRMAAGALREGVEPDRVHEVADAAEALAVLKSHLRAGDTVLLKASRVAGLEVLAEALREEAP